MKRIAIARLISVIIPLFSLAPEAIGQTTAAERYRVLTDPEGLDKALDKAKAQKEKIRPPYEFFKSDIAPFDILPYVKPNHWVSMSLEIRSNFASFEGQLRSAPVKLPGMPHAIVFRRDARLQQDQTTRLGFQLMFPEIPNTFRELPIELSRPDSIRPDASSMAPIKRLEPHQMLIPILGPDANGFNFWSKMHAMLPASGDKDPLNLDRTRYYRLIVPQNPEKPVLSTQPLTWTTISHVIWDDLSPDILSPGQQAAMIDWLQFGGQLVIVSGLGTSMAALREGALAPYLPATSSGQTIALGQAELEPLSKAYRPALWPGEWEDALETNNASALMNERNPPSYRLPEPIKPPLNRPLNLAGLIPSPGSTPIYLDKPGGPILGVERRVGRGRVLMLAFQPTDPSLVAWSGYDELVRRVIVRRPEESWAESVAGVKRKAYRFLAGPDLSWYRLLSRDLGSFSAGPPPDATAGDQIMPQEPVAAWTDTASEIPIAARKALEVASGIKIPPHTFVLQVMLAYVVALVPINWLICRYLIRRREIAWVVVPILALGFAFGVERLAARDLGYDSACDELDLVELQGGYPRAHVSRFAALYSTGRVNYSISFPDDPNALALPLNMQRSLSVEEVQQSTWQSTPEPALIGFPVQPRSLAMFRAEHLTHVGGSIDLVDDESGRRVVNGSGLELRDAVLVDVDRNLRYPLGTIAAGSTATIPKTATAKLDSTQPVPWIDAESFLERFRSYSWSRPEDKGELRLVAWSPDPFPGQTLAPKVDRHRGIRLVIAHLTYGPPPDSSKPPYYRVPDIEQDRALQTYLKADSRNPTNMATPPNTP